MSEKNNFSPFDFDHYSRQVREFFSDKRRIRNRLREKRYDYGLTEQEQVKFLAVLSMLIKDENPSNKSIEEYFEDEMSEIKNMNEKFKVFEKYYNLLKDCYGKNVSEIMSEVDMESKLKRLQDER